MDRAVAKKNAPHRSSRWVQSSLLQFSVRSLGALVVNQVAAVAAVVVAAAVVVF